MRTVGNFLKWLPLVVISFMAQAETWQGTLQDGSQIAIDPDTNKVMRSSEGESHALWDGVHQLDNGAVIIINDGVVVKDMAVLKVEQENIRRQHEEACMTLVRKVCGPRNECDKQPSCDAARQLLVLENEERHNEWGDTNTESTKSCIRSLSQEDFFQACTARGANQPLTPCEELQQQVCGSKDQCKGSDSCNAATQLVKMEREDGYAPTGNPTATSDQCKGLLAGKQDDFFVHCKK